MVYIDGVSYMLNIAAILVIMQLFILPIRLGEYEESIDYCIRHVFKSERVIYLFTMFITHLFSSFLLFGTIPVMLSLLASPLKSTVSNYQKFTVTAISRGYALVVMWTPGGVNMLLALTATGAQWSDVFLPSLTISLMGLSISYLMQRGQLSNRLQSDVDEEKIKEAGAGRKAAKKILVIFFIVVALVILIFFFGTLQIGDNTSRIMLAGLILSLCWLATFFRRPDLKVVFKEYLTQWLPKTVDLAVLYIGMGVFSKALDASGLLNELYPYIGTGVTYFGLFALPIISFFVFLLSMLGLHPFVIIIILGNIIMSLQLPFLTPAMVAVALAFGSTASYMLSPFAGIVLTTAKYLDTTPYQVGIWNSSFVLRHFIAGSIFIMLWSIWLA